MADTEHFWKDIWQNKRYQIGWHKPNPNPLLVKFWDSVLGAAAHDSTAPPPPRHHVFVPLSGKSLDVHWFLQEKHLKVTVCELSRLAIEELFAELNMTPTITVVRDEEGEETKNKSPDAIVSNKIEKFEAGDLTAFVGNIFALRPTDLVPPASTTKPPIDLVYDRAALYALPPETRAKYAPFVASLCSTTAGDTTNAVPLPPLQFLLCLQYPPGTIPSPPPFCVSEDEVKQLYSPLQYNVAPVGAAEDGSFAAMESVAFALVPKK